MDKDSNKPAKMQVYCFFLKRKDYQLKITKWNLGDDWKSEIENIKKIGENNNAANYCFTVFHENQAKKLLSVFALINLIINNNIFQPLNF